MWCLLGDCSAGTLVRLPVPGLLDAATAEGQAALDELNRRRSDQFRLPGTRAAADEDFESPKGIHDANKHSSKMS